MSIRTAVRDLRTVRQLLTAADQEAARDGEASHGPEHLLLAALTLPDGAAGHLLGVDVERLRRAVADVHVEALAAVGLDGCQAAPHPRENAGVLRATPQAQQVFQEAVASARQSTPALLTGAHVVAAVCDQDRGTVVRALTALGVDRTELRARARAVAGVPG